MDRCELFLPGVDVRLEDESGLKIPDPEPDLDIAANLSKKGKENCWSVLVYIPRTL